MAIPLKYNLRNLMVRRGTTLMTAFSVALAVTVLVALMALAEGLQAALSGTGQPLNLIVLRDGSESETMSSVPRDAVGVIKYMDGVGRDEKGDPSVSPEMAIVVHLKRRSGAKESNVIIRGLGPQGVALRPEFKLIEGRMARPGLRELLVSRRVADRYQHCALGERLKLGRSVWTVAGVFAAGNSAYNSEIWASSDELAADFDRADYSSVLVRASDPAAMARVQDQISSDRRLRLITEPERSYFERQTTAAAPIRLFGLLIAVLMGIGASFSAMNTMYAAGARRAREIGTLRAIGFSRASILISFVMESSLIAVLGGLAGCVLVLPLNGMAAGTTNFVTFSDLAFNLRVTPALMSAGIGFALVLGVLGGFLPARSAASKEVVAALRGA